jgi:septal ring factor EnvC (AmiA/AmiB activator)
MRILNFAPFKLNALPLVLALCVALLFNGFISPAKAQAKQKTAEEIQQEINDLDLEIDFLKIKVKTSGTKTARLNKNIATKKKEVEALKLQINQLNKAIEETEINIKKLETEEEACNIRIKSILIRYKSRLVQLHKIKQGTLLSSILAAKDVNSFLNRYQMVKYLLENDKIVIEELNQEENKRAVVARDLSEKYKHLGENKNELLAKEKRLNMESKGLNAMLSTMMLEKKVLVDKEKKLLKEKEALRQGLKAIDKIVQSTIPKENITQPAPKIKETAKVTETTPDNLRAQVMQFDWPVARQQRGQVREIDEEGAYAIMVNVKEDSEIMAAARGKVIYKGAIGGLGEVVILQHERGFTSVYARLDNIWVGLNEVLEKGEVVGKIAAGGRNAALHFEIRFGSRKQRPLEYLPN